jgi:integrase
MLRAPEFIVGIETAWHERARESAEAASRGLTLQQADIPNALIDAWRRILQAFPNAKFGAPALVAVRWPSTEVYVSPKNDFQRAFYYLFLQGWRARLCPRCEANRFFIARKPKQMFCGTKCSAGNRLASKRKWWRSVGAKRRASQRDKT